MDANEFQNRMSYTSVFQNFGSLAQNWVPSEKEKLLCRDREIDHMITLFRPIITEDAPFSANLLVLGGGGIGKTVTVKYFAKNFRDFARKTAKVTIEYYDCLQHKTKSAILRDMVGKVNFCDWPRIFRSRTYEANSHASQEHQPIFADYLG